MAKPPPTFASLEGLLEYGHRDGFDIRPTLLRVLTDLYLQKPTHPADDERYYTELALRLIGSTDVTARAAVAERLASYAAAPRAVILRLARDVINVAGSILRDSPCVTTADLETIAAECGAAHAAIIAPRLSAGKPNAGNRIAQITQIRAGDRTRPQPVELAELFFSADGTERRHILLNLDYTTPAPPGVAPERSSEIVGRLETAALAHNSDAFTREIELAFGITSQLARRIVSDELGEPIVVIAKAMRAPRAVLERILLFINPRIGQSVRQVYELATRYDEISTQAALRLVAIWQRAAPRENLEPRVEAVSRRSTAEGARPLWPAGVRRPILQHDARLRGQTMTLAKR